MTDKPLKKIYRKSKKRDMSFRHVCEVGVYLPETSNIIDFIKDGIRATLVEADMDKVEKIKSYFNGYNINIFRVAVWDYSGIIKLSKAAASTFVTELKSSPAVVNDKYKISQEDTFEVPCMIFSDIDDSTIDLLSIDIEGSEWYVLKYLKSRPAVISVETHGKYYTNPFITEIQDWMERENYILWFKDASDTVFVRRNVLIPSIADKINNRLVEVKLGWKKFKRNFKKR